MAFDIVIAPTGNICLVTDGEFPKGVTRVDYSRKTRRIAMISENDGQVESASLQVPVHETLAPAFDGATKIYLARMKDKELDAFDEVELRATSRYIGANPHQKRS